MGWADAHIAKLKAGETVQFRPRGNSMKGKINDGQLVTVEPVTSVFPAQVGDVVLCKVGLNQYLHFVEAVKTLSNRGQAQPVLQYLIGNNRGGTNGWTTGVFGRVTKIE
jgi:hypothetical protein